MMSKRRGIVLTIVAVIALFVYIIERTLPKTSPSAAAPTTVLPSSSPSETISPSQAWSHVGQTETVQYYVSYTGSSSAGTEFLDQYQNYTSGFITTIFASDVPSWPIDPGATYLDHTINVTGTITVYDGYVEIVAYEPNQISIVK